MGEVASRLNRDGTGIAASPVSAVRLAGLLARIADSTISGKIAKEVFDAMWSGQGGADTVIAARDLRQISDLGALEAIVDQIIATYPCQAAEYRAGKDKLIGFFVGRAMKATQGKANPGQLSDLVKRKLMSSS